MHRDKLWNTEQSKRGVELLVKTLFLDHADRRHYTRNDDDAVDWRKLGMKFQTAAQRLT